MSVLIVPTSVLSIPRGVRLRFDKVRDRWFLLGPERVFEPDDISVEILQRIDGHRDVAAMTKDLAQAFDAPEDEVCRDVISFAQGLVDIRMLNAEGAS